MDRAQFKRWQVFRNRNGSLVQCGQVAACNQPQAIRKARERWSMYIETNKKDAGFVVRLADRYDQDVRQ